MNVFRGILPLAAALTTVAVPSLAAPMILRAPEATASAPATVTPVQTGRNEYERELRKLESERAKEIARIEDEARRESRKAARERDKATTEGKPRGEVRLKYIDRTREIDAKQRAERAKAEAEFEKKSAELRATHR